MDVVIERRAISENQLLDARLHPVLRRAYAARGVRDDAELALTLDRLVPVSTLDSIESAVLLILEHRERRILVVGDFDADGATSTALIVRCLRSWGFAAVDFLVPNRFEFGYGLTPEIVGLAAERAPSLIVTVDNGISSIAGVAAARERGIQVLITDHHLPGASLPAADVIVNPNVPGSRFASRALAGVGVAFYVMAALRRELEARGTKAEPAVTEFLDLVALGTVADLVPLDANNRVLVAQGIRRIRAGRAVPGIRALLSIAGRNAASLTAADLGFSIGPRLNAAGRLDDMSIGIRCLLSDSESEALSLATRLDQLNAERREIEAKMQDAALNAVARLRDPDGPVRHGVCLFDAGWHQGVVGLVASRIKDRVRRPVIAFARAGDGQLRGSARSVPGIHIRDVLDRIAARNPELISRFGGHAMAAGLSLEEARLDAFALAFDAEVAELRDPSIPSNRVETDGELTTEEIALETAQALRDGGPWGQAFPEPCFDGRFAVKNARVVGDKHLKMWVTTADRSRHFDAIAFNFKGVEEAAALPDGDVRLVYRLDINEYKGERRLQLLVDHVLK
ncbi:MAG TPA: single-stranded-DNA-specific exonuclease RecJ [Steroidobacteraceae bacterium]|jgi:single-stranded-DNA-specific exonuclease|nr:single-stranded-DNA-specific exonuclease RecJ [Steroidobacteraceae bacterium]